MEAMEYYIIEAIRKGDLKTLTFAIENKQNVNAYFMCETALHVACHVGDANIVDYLLQAGADLNVQNTASKETPLHLACQEGHIKVIQLLIDRHADINAFMLHRSTPLRVACVKGHTEVVHMLLKHGGNVNTPDRTGRTPLITAVEQGHHEMVCLLLDANCDKDAKDTLGRNAVFQAVHKRYSTILHTLISAGCDQNAVNMRGVSPLHCAARIGFFDMIRILLDSGCDKDIQGNLGGQALGYTPLWESIQSGHLIAVQMLLEAGASPEVADHYSLGNALFAMMMSNHCRHDILHVLLDAGVNVSYANGYGYSALHFAVDKNWYDAALFLVHSDCEISSEIHWLNEYQARTDLSTDGKEFINYVLALPKEPKTLKSLCRLYLRKQLHLPRPLYTKIDKLPLPSQMKKFLLYRA